MAPGQEGSFLSRQRWPRAASTGSLGVGGRTKPLADTQAPNWLRDEPGALSVMHSMLCRVMCCNQGNRRGFLGYSPRVSQPAALCGILERPAPCYKGALGSCMQEMQNTKPFNVLFILSCLSCCVTTNDHHFLWRVWVGRYEADAEDSILLKRSLPLSSFI